MPLDQPIDAVTTSPPPDPAAIEQLKALGYVD
jgi:hypothetical protein